MSYFAEALGRLLIRKKLKPADVHRSVGTITNTDLSRMLNGQKTRITKEELDALAPAISDNPEEQAELVIAHLKDECFGPGSHLVEIKIRGYSPNNHKDNLQTHKKLAPKLEEAFKVLREHINTDKDIRDSILALANIVSKGTSKID